MRRIRKYIIWLLEGVACGGAIAMLLSWTEHFPDLLLEGFVVTLSALLGIWIIELVM